MAQPGGDDDMHLSTGQQQGRRVYDPTWLRSVRTTDRVDLRERVVEVARGWVFGGALVGSGADLDGVVPAAVRTILRIDQPVRSSTSELSQSAANTTLVGSMLPGQHPSAGTPCRRRGSVEPRAS